MKSLLSLLVLYMMFSFSACKKDDDSADNNNNNNDREPEANEVLMKGSVFNPGTLTVKAGTTVKFTNNDNMAHTATSTTGVFDSGNLSPSRSYSYTFQTAGTYPYYCGLHPFMTGTVVVTN
jgi:plastocyanin